MTTEPLFDSTTFRRVCGQFPTGVTAVTAVTDTGEVAALTVNSFTSVSLEPAKVLFCLATSSSSFDRLQRARRIAVHILAQDQEDVARRFATSGLSGEEKLEGVEWTAGPDGVPIIPDTPAILAGTTDEAITSGDHVIFVLDVDHVHLKPGPVPALSFYQGRFASPTAVIAE
ncbi:flavin reductase family protein [Nocardioides sp. zg-536]|uniref:Flavin reductase family protein n=1 Tax=Nocardioides faecalis TaxID=2803858 RepID=A0A938Y8J2_9ACTN|nr:flavin reductase family protein [Nocardioides faecalis]MBM9461174.1 flavin reductase family protein [Nocardioides faecalis]MBS4752173.1 flavin reductase family protein [Nocardioides faecalis]QVI59023.1 flavin reductase family protein [Nocardioides faecalis]